MNDPTSASHIPANPSPDDLAGTPATQEEDHPTIRVHGAPSAPPIFVRPTPDDLAGISITADGKEDLTVRPRAPRSQP